MNHIAREPHSGGLQGSCRSGLTSKPRSKPSLPGVNVILEIFRITPWTAIGLLVGGGLWLATRRHHPVSRWQIVFQVGILAGLFAVLSWRLGGKIGVLVPSAFAVTAVPLAQIDWRNRILPNWCVSATYIITGCALFTVSIAQRDPGLLLRVLIGALFLLLFYGALYGVFPGQLGGGDVKFAGVSGAVMAWHSWPTVITGLLLIWLLSVIAQMSTLILQGRKIREDMPHGPFIVIGTVAAILLPY